MVVYQLMKRGILPQDLTVLAEILKDEYIEEQHDMTGTELENLAGRYAADLGALGAVAAAGRYAEGQAAAKAAEAEARAAVTSVFDVARNKGAWQWDMALGDYVPTRIPIGGAPAVGLTEAVNAGIGGIAAGQTASTRFLVNPGTGAWVSMAAMQDSMQWADDHRTGGDTGVTSETMTKEQIEEMLNRRELEMQQHNEDGEEPLDTTAKQTPEQELGHEFWDWWSPFSTDD